MSLVNKEWIPLTGDFVSYLGNKGNGGLFKVVGFTREKLLIERISSHTTEGQFFPAGSVISVLKTSVKRSSAPIKMRIITKVQY